MKLLHIESDNLDIRRRGTSFVIVCLVMSAVTALSIPLSLLREDTQSLIFGLLITSATFGFYLIGIFLARKGHVNIAGIITSLGVTLILTVAVLLPEDTSYWATLITMVFPPLLAGIAMRPRGLIPIVIIDVLLLISLGFLRMDKGADPGFIALLGAMCVLGPAIGFCISVSSVINERVTRQLIETTIRLDEAVDVANHAQKEAEVAKDAAEQASQAKGRFLATMSHELRTPLNAVIGYSELIEFELKDQEPDVQASIQDLGRIRYAGAHLLALIGDILDLAKLDEGDTILRLSTVDVNQLLTNIGETVQTLVQQNKNTLQVDCHDVGLMHTDATRLRQILLNLLSNAAKFTYRGDIHLGAHLDNGNIVFTVRDTGIGISEEALTRIFEAFEQADNTTTRQYEGSGLGLTLCRRFSKSLGGAIEVVSAPGKGSTFTVTLPVGSPQDASHEQRI